MGVFLPAMLYSSQLCQFMVCEWVLFLPQSWNWKMAVFERWLLGGTHVSLNHDYGRKGILQGPLPFGIFESMMFLFLRLDMLVPWKVWPFKMLAMMAMFWTSVLNFRGSYSLHVTCSIFQACLAKIWGITFDDLCSTTESIRSGSGVVLFWADLVSMLFVFVLGGGLFPWI